MDAYALLKQAIQERQPMVAVYDGERREFCPHALGTKGRRRHVLAFQFGGGSRSGLATRGESRPTASLEK